VLKRCKWLAKSISHAMGRDIHMSFAIAMIINSRSYARPDIQN
jgi:hypothetical protein